MVHSSSPKETNLGVAQAFLISKRYHIKNIVNEYFYISSHATLNVVSLAAVFSLVTQRSSPQGGALRDETKNGCEGDYSK